MLSFGSLFTGIGGMDLGLERAGWECKWQVEIDPYCRQVLAKHWPDVPRFEDVRGVTGDQLEPVDLIAGGFPCQDVSQAGKRTVGIDGARSGLWSEFARIIRVLRPRLVLVENVPGLAVRGLGRVLGDLAALGYDAEWSCISAADVGAPHLRRRIFLLAAPTPLPDAFRNVLRIERERGGQQYAEQGSREPRHDGQAVAHSDPQGREGPKRRGVSGAAPRDGLFGGSRSEVANSNGWGREGERRQEREPELPQWNEPDGYHLPQWPPAPGDVLAWGQVPPAAQPALCRLADGLPDGLVRGRRAALRAYGNAVVPQVAEVIGRAIMEGVEC